MSVALRAKAKLIQRQRARTQPDTPVGLLDFVPKVSPKFLRPDHLKPLADVFERINDGGEEYVVVHAPPRHGKTDTILHGIAWLLQQNPSLRIAFCSYSLRLARNKSRRARQLSLAAGVQMDPDRTASAEWGTRAGGVVFAAGRGGPLTGEGFDVIIVDDPLKNRAEAESKTIRDGLAEWFTSTAITRLEPGGSVIVAQTRWHEDDLPGRLLKAKDVSWQPITLKAINDDGEALWPQRWPVEALQRRRALITEMDWWSLFQGAPRPRGGTVFGEPVFYTEHPANCRHGAGLDFAYTAKTNSDWNVLIEGVAADGKVYVTNMERRQCRSHEWKETLRVRRAVNRHAKWVAYCSGVERGVVDLLNAETDLSIQVESASTDKLLRAQPAARGWNTERLLVPDPEELPTDWLAPLLSEVASFTGLNDKHDDCIDGLAGLWKALTTAAVPSALSGGLFETSNPWAM